MNDTNDHTDTPMDPRLKVKSGVEIIAIHGHAGVGKDTISEWLRNEYMNTYQESFADPLKRACAEAFGILGVNFYEPSLKEFINFYWDASPRQIAQFFGTELFRNHIEKLIPWVGQDFWIARMTRTLNGDVVEGPIYDSSDTVVIPDLRFQNEFDWVVANGGHVIHLTRPGADGKVGIPNHASEAGIKFHSQEVVHEIVNDGTLEELYRKVDIIIEIINLRKELKKIN